MLGACFRSKMPKDQKKKRAPSTSDSDSGPDDRAPAKKVRMDFYTGEIHIWNCKLTTVNYFHRFIFTFLVSYKYYMNELIDWYHKGLMQW